MDEEIVKRAARTAAEAPPAFRSVVSARQPRRMRKLRVGLVALVLATAAAAPFVLQPTHNQSEFALLTPPTTDWLLETPDPQWVAQLDQAIPQNTEEEPPHVH